MRAEVERLRGERNALQRALEEERARNERLTQESAEQQAQLGRLERLAETLFAKAAGLEARSLEAE